MYRALCLLLALLATGCGGPEGGGSSESASPLADLALRPDDAPSGLELDEEASGEMGSFQEVLPPRSDVPQVQPLPKTVRRSFVGGYDARYRGTGQDGATSLTSSVLRFSDAANAEGFLGYLQEVQTRTGTREVGTVEVVETPGLGEEGYAWHRAVPGAETSGCSWRRGDLVLTLTLGGPAGQASLEAAIDLASTVDGRLP